MSVINFFTFDLLFRPIGYMEQSHISLNTRPPFFSIIIPSYNRPVELGRCLDAITNLDYTGNFFEVNIIDDGGTAQLDDKIADYHDFFP